MKSSITPRIYYSTYLRFRKNFKAQRGETMASYFERLSKWIELEQTKRDGKYLEKVGDAIVKDMENLK